MPRAQPPGERPPAYAPPGPARHAFAPVGTGEADALVAASVSAGFSAKPDTDPLLSVVVDLLPVAVLILDQTRTPVFMNPAAERVVQDRWLFVQRPNGALELADRSQRPAFHAFLATLLDASPPGSEAGLRFFVKRAAAQPVSITGGACPQARQGRGAVLFVRVPESDVALAGVPLQALFGLTRAEAALASALVAGESLADYCQRRGVSINTGKTQLKAVLAKTGTNRQAQLVRLLAV
jgi:DNA-binding CsgD family transcriptional regulator